MKNPYYYYWDIFLTFETNLILFLQDKLKPIENYLAFITEWCGPYGIENFFIPLAGSFNTDIMFELFAVTGVVNLFTDIFKLIFQSYRPFWWINETSVYSKLKRPINLYQNIFTCETSSGIISRHSSLLTVILLLEIKRIKFILYKIININSKIIDIIINVILIILLCIMWLSRIYFSCNFLHQCIIGSICGLYAVTEYRSRIKNQILNANKMIAIIFVVLSGGLIGSIYLIMKTMDFDPQHSIRMAFKWCQDPSYLSPDTTVMVSICSNLGTLLGIAFTLPFKQKIEKKLNPLLTVPLTIILIYGKYNLQIYTPKYNGRFIFLAWKCLTNFIFSFLMLWGVTKCVVIRNVKIKKN